MAGDGRQRAEEQKFEQKQGHTSKQNQASSAWYSNEAKENKRVHCNSGAFFLQLSLYVSWGPEKMTQSHE